MDSGQLQRNEPFSRIHSRNRCNDIHREAWGFSLVMGKKRISNGKPLRCDPLDLSQKAGFRDGSNDVPRPGVDRSLRHTMYMEAAG